MRNIIYIFIFLLKFSIGFSQSDSIDVFLESQMLKRNIPGLQLAIIENGAIVKTGNYGLANIQDSISVDSNTIFTINSMTKAFTGVAIMQLVEQGKLDLSAPVSEYLDGLPVEWRTVTIKQLLTHTSGIPDIMDSNGKMVSNAGDDASWKKVQELPMDFKPNEQFRYNQTNYLLLGRIIDLLSETRFTEFIKGQQLQKVNMKKTASAGFGHFQDVIPHSARGYTYFRNGKLTSVYEEFSPFLRTAAGMSSTAKELAAWIIALQNGQLLKNQASLTTLWTPAILNNGKTGGFNRLLNGYALGWPVIARAEHSAVAPIGGGRAALFVYPKDNLAIVILTNLQGAFPESFIDEVAGFYIPEMKRSNGFGLPPFIKLVWEQLEKKGYKYSIQTVENIKKKNKNFELKENEINSWGYQLLEQDEKKKALEIFKLNIYLFPESANTYDSLGEAYAILGMPSLAIKNYEFSLKLDPKNTNATEQIEKLKSKQE